MPVATITENVIWTAENNENRIVLRAKNNRYYPQRYIIGEHGPDWYFEPEFKGYKTLAGAKKTIEMPVVTKAQKKATILDREVVSDHYVVYICLSSDGVTKYRTTLVDGIATGCTCPARTGCYHKTTCQAQERFEIAWNAPIEPAQVWSQNDEGTHVVESIEEGEFEIEAAAIIAIEKRKAFEQVCAEVRKIEQRGRRERAALGPQERKVEQGPSGAMVLMRAS